MPLVKVAIKDSSSCGVEPASDMRCVLCALDGVAGWSLEEHSPKRLSLLSPELELGFALT